MARKSKTCLRGRTGFWGFLTVGPCGMHPLDSPAPTGPSLSCSSCVQHVSQDYLRWSDVGSAAAALACIAHTNHYVYCSLQWLLTTTIWLSIQSKSSTTSAMALSSIGNHFNQSSVISSIKPQIKSNQINQTPSFTSYQAIKPSSHQAIKPSSHQAIKSSSHQVIKSSSHQAISFILTSSSQLKPTQSLNVVKGKPRDAYCFMVKLVSPPLLFFLPFCNTISQSVLAVELGLVWWWLLLWPVVLDLGWWKQKHELCVSCTRIKWVLLNLIIS